MKRRKVRLSPEARDDLVRLYDWIAGRASPEVAMAYVERLEAYCVGFDLASERGHRRDDLRAGLRIVGFEKRVTIAFAASENDATILRLFYGGQSWELAFD